MLPVEQASGSTGIKYKTVMEVLARKNMPEIKHHCSTLETYEETHLFILMDITEDVVESVAWKLSGIAGPVERNRNLYRVGY